MGKIALNNLSRDKQTEGPAYIQTPRQPGTATRQYIDAILIPTSVHILNPAFITKYAMIAKPDFITKYVMIVKPDFITEYVMIAKPDVTKIKVQQLCIGQWKGARLLASLSSERSKLINMLTLKIN
ncbi:hypothetical protein DPMN_172591 [Dreissena polymorpha]|uniref:Uncharacterized protein n=1 Tax=Dreissena polymorpha TaxID=45954 RepID=A0A9D4E1C3_DREPO|nr:hypothetical protein DPMN_172591 [Dreissena polymorpha]